MTETSTRTAQSLSSRLREHPVTALREELDDLVTRVFGGADDGWFGGRMAPLADVVETDTTLEVSLDLPGINPDDVEIRLSGNTLNIRGEKKEEREQKGRTFHRVERRRGAFVRSLALPCDVQEDEAAAEYKDGVLTITLPKCEEAKSRKIKVKKQS